MANIVGCAGWWGNHNIPALHFLSLTFFFLKIRLKFAVLFNRNQSTAARPVEGRPPKLNIIINRPNLHSVVITKPILKGTCVLTAVYYKGQGSSNINNEVQRDTCPLSYSFLSFRFNYRATPRHFPLFIGQFSIVYGLCTYNYMDFVPSF